MNRTMIRKAFVPITLTLLALVLVNIGLYTRLAAQPQAIQIDLPYIDNFEGDAILRYPGFGGD